jgi:SPX domain
LCLPPPSTDNLPSVLAQKLIKELPSLVPAEIEERRQIAAGRQSNGTTGVGLARPGSPEESVHSHGTSSSTCSPQQQHGDKTTEAQFSPTPYAGIGGPSSSGDERVNELEQRKEELGRNPGEKAFFKLLHTELKKASHFFEKAQQEYQIREERVREGLEIMKQPNSILVNEKWSLLARSCYRLYKDLLLLETFAIMTYCSFSKILKKHDKVTGYQTRTAFMERVVNKANFSAYPRLLEMIGRCEQLYERVSERLVQEGKDVLYEDERLFINMINRLNEQVLNTEPERKDGRQASSSRPPTQIDFPIAPLSASQGERADLSALRSLVAENDAVANAAHVSEGCVDTDRKPPASTARETKRQKTE